MKSVVYDDRENMLAWAQERLVGLQFRSDAQAIGLKSDQGYHGVVVYDTFTNTSCNLSVASDGSRQWLNREYIIRAMAYPFIQLQLPRLTAFVSVMNFDSIKFCRHFGFTKEGEMREAGIFGENLIIFGLLKRDCKWLDIRMTSQNRRQNV